VELAVAAAEMLAGERVKAAVVSMPCWELFERQSDSYRAEVLGNAPRVGIEAAARLGWDRWLGPNGIFIGMDSFGASGPSGQVYRQFGITVEAAAAAARSLIER
jgi:transketolase